MQLMLFTVNIRAHLSVARMVKRNKLTVSNKFYGHSFCVYDTVPQCGQLECKVQPKLIAAIRYTVIY